MLFRNSCDVVDVTPIPVVAAADLSGIIRAVRRKPVLSLQKCYCCSYRFLYHIIISLPGMFARTRYRHRHQQPSNRELFLIFFRFILTREHCFSPVFLRAFRGKVTESGQTIVLVLCGSQCLRNEQEDHKSWVRGEKHDVSLPRMSCRGDCFRCRCTCNFCCSCGNLLSKKLSHH